MKTKNFILRSLLCLMFALSAVLFVACDKAKPKSLEILSGVPDAIYQDAELDLTNLKIKVVYDDDTFKTVGLNDVDYTFSSATLGAQELVITLKNTDLSVKTNIIVVEQGGNLDVKVNSLNSGLLTGRHADSFVNKTNNLVAGDDNYFDLQLNAISSEGNSYTDIETEVTVEMLDAENNFVAVETPATYLTSERSRVQFTGEAVGKTFRLTVAAKYYNKTQPSFQLVVDVVDGYNIYTAKDLSVITNMDKVAEGEDDWGWKKWKEDNNYANITTNAAVFQNDIVLRDGDLPSYYFYTQAEVDALKTGGKLTDSSTNLEMVGSLKDAYAMGLYQRNISANENFAIYGNYFTLDAENLSKMIMGRGKNEFVNYYGENDDRNTQITAHTCIFRIVGESENSKLDIADLSVRGNSKRTTDTRNSGGVLLAKIQGLNSEVKNCSYSNCYIGYMFERTGDDEDRARIEDKLEQKLIDTTGYDSYNSLLYFYGASNVLIEGGEYVGAGGPVMIVDHVENEKATGADGTPSNIVVIGAKLESLVTGYEPWFVSDGADALVPQIKANNAAFEKNGTTFLQTKDNVAGLMNLKVVYKSSETEGISSSVVRGGVSYFDTRAEYEAQTREENPVKSQYILDMTTYSIQASNEKATKFENSRNGEILGSTTYLLIPDNLMSQAAQPTNIYVVKLTDIEALMGGVVKGVYNASADVVVWFQEGTQTPASQEHFDLVDTNVSMGGNNISLKTFVVNDDSSTGYAVKASQGITNINCYLFNGMAIMLELYNKAN